MSELITVDMDTETVSARDLYEKLEIAKRFSAWFEPFREMFEENEDFRGAYLKVQSNQYGGEKDLQDYQISIDMAKHICMMSKSEKGKMFRQYFIDLEKAWNTPEQIMARALKMADQKINNLKIENQEMKPKALFADAVSASKTSILIGDLAKLICQNGYSIGQKRLFDWMREQGYLIKSGNSRNMPMQRFLEQGLFEVKESNVQNPDGSVRITKTTKVTGKGQVYFVNKFVS